MTSQTISAYEKRLMTQIMAQERAISVIYDQFVREVSGYLAKYKPTGLISSSVWIRNKEIEKIIDRQLKVLNDNLTKYINHQTDLSWNLSHDKTDMIVNSYIAKMALSDIVKEGLFFRNMDALDAFRKRSVNGLGLSERIWKVCEGAKDNIELYLQSGIGTGRSAVQISKDVRGLLKEPDKLFRRIRDPKTGKLIPSRPMAGYHPGPGVNRSSFKNALRMSRTETNMAYRLADQARWGNIDFITGYEIKLSNNHPQLDICDSMVGTYPKTFVFSGWHPNCYCYAVPVLISQDQFAEYINTGKIGAKPIKGIPPQAFNYIKERSAKLAAMENKPYWLKGNFVMRNGVYYPRQGVQSPPKITGVILENPTNIPVSNAFKQIAPSIKAKVDDALSIINSVHGDGKLPIIPVQVNNSMKASGAFGTIMKVSDNLNIPVSILINANNTGTELTFIHEVGHFLDCSAIGKAGFFESTNGKLLGDVLGKAYNSKAIRELIDIKKKVVNPEGLQYIDYLLSPDEVWARAYAQFIAEKSKSRKLLTSLDEIRILQVPYQWQKDDFAEIMVEIEKLFKQLGWL